MEQKIHRRVLVQTDCVHNQTCASHSASNVDKLHLIHVCIIFFLPTSTKPRAWKLSKNNGCDDFLFGVHCVEEGDRIPPLQSYGQALKQENCFSGVLGDDCGVLLLLLLLVVVVVVVVVLVVVVAVVVVVLVVVVVVAVAVAVAAAVAGRGKLKNVII